MSRLHRLELLEVIPAVLGRGAANDLLEYAGKMRYGCEPDLLADVGDGELRAHEEVLRRMAADGVVVIEQGLSGAGLEYTREIAPVDVEFAGDALKRELAIITLIDEALGRFGQFLLAALPFGLVRAATAARAIAQLLCLCHVVEQNDTLRRARSAGAGWPADDLAPLDRVAELLVAILVMILDG